MKRAPFSFRSHVRESWLQVSLGLVSTLLILASFLLPWWRINFIGEYRDWPAVVYPYGAYGELPVVGLPVNPMYFVIFTAGFLVCITLALLGSFIKGNKGKISLGAAGATLLGIASFFYWRIVARTTSEGLLPEGTVRVGLGVYPVETAFQLGFRIAFLAGAICIASAVFLFAYEKRRRK